MRIFLICVIFAIANNAVAEQYSVGFRAIESENESGFSGGVWYPSVDKEFVKKWGPFRPSWAWDGKPAAGKFPLILLSHGVTGRYHNHRDTAATLAQRGYVVIIPQHTKDQWIGTSKSVAVVEHRIAEFSRTLKAFTNADLEIAKIIDRDNIGAIGYSLGGLTVLGASGAIPNIQYIDEHCLQNEQLDPVFCFNVAWWQRVWLWIKGTDLVHWFYDTNLEDKEVIDQLEPPVNFKAIVVVAPVAVAYYPKQIQDIKAKMAIFRLEADKINRFPFHADYIHRSLGEKDHVYKVFKDAHHFAFISPFPEWLFEEKHIPPIAIDPEGFDRSVFLENINADILNFFKTHIPVNTDITE